MYSTPLSLLHLPPNVLPEVTQQLTQHGNSSVRFFQDGKNLDDFKQLLSDVDFQIVIEVDVEIGFVCKKCQMVYPSESMCLNHQKSSCFITKALDEIKSTLKLVQVQLECSACRERFPTFLDLRFHCSLERHVKQIQREKVPIPPVSSNSSVHISPILEVPSASISLAMGNSTTNIPLPPLGGTTHATLRGSVLPIHPVLGRSSVPLQGGSTFIPSPAIESPFSVRSENNKSSVNCSESPIFNQQDRLDTQVVLDNLIEQGQENQSVNIPVSDRMPPTTKAAICNSGEASVSPENKRL